MQVKIEGLAELERKLKKMSDDVSGPIRTKALEQTAETFRQDAHDKCPAKGLGSIDGHYKAQGEASANSGAVRQSIKVGSVTDGGVRVGTNHMLAKELEYGGKGGRERPHPFMRRAADDQSTRGAIKEIYISELKKGLV